MHRAALAAVIPRRVVRRLYPDEPTEGLPAELCGMLRAGGGPRGYLCRGTQCDTPAETVAVWQDLLRSASRRLDLVPA
jgi:uncharacterized protein YyaL (SSP411 family)